MKWLPVFAAVTVTFATTTPAADEPQKPPPKQPEKPADAAAAPDLKKPVARINGEEITREDLLEAVRAVVMTASARGQPFKREQLPAVERGVLNEMIGQKLLLEEGRKTKIEDLDKKVK